MSLGLTEVAQGGGRLTKAAKRDYAHRRADTTVWLLTVWGPLGRVLNLPQLCEGRRHFQRRVSLQDCSGRTQ